MADALYETRNRLTRRAALTVAGCAAFTVIGLWMIHSPEDPWSYAYDSHFWGWVSVGLFGGGGVFFLIMSLRTLGKPALRVDHDGLFLGGYPARYRQTCFKLGWQDIGCIVLFKIRRVPHIGLKGNGKPLQVPGTRSELLRRMNERVIGLGPDVAATCRPLVTTTIDAHELARTVAAVAPHVKVVDLRS